MTDHGPSRNAEEFEAEILDQDNRVLGTAKVLREPGRERQMLWILSGGHSEYICSSAKFLRRKTGEIYAIHRLAPCEDVNHQAHIHFSFVK